MIAGKKQISIFSNTYSFSSRKFCVFAYYSKAKQTGENDNQVKSLTNCIMLLTFQTSRLRSDHVKGERTF